MTDDLPVERPEEDVGLAEEGGGFWRGVGDLVGLRWLRYLGIDKVTRAQRTNLTFDALGIALVITAIIMGGAGPGYITAWVLGWFGFAGVCVSKTLPRP